MSSPIKKCKRCNDRDYIIDGQGPKTIALLNDLGYETGHPSLVESSEIVCCVCAVDEIHHVLMGGREIPMIEWPVSELHPMTQRLGEIIDEEIDRVVSARTA